MSIILIVAAIIIGYLLGSIPTAYIVTKWRKGIDIRTVDVGNVGAAATMRQVGIKEGLIVAIVDVAKGAASVLIAQALGLTQIWVLCAGFAAFLGHCFPIYIGFRGGQGTATVIGIFFVLTPLVMVIILIVMAIVLFLVRRIFPMICIVSPLLPILVWFMAGSLALILFALVIVIIMTARNFKGINKEIKSAVNRIKMSVSKKTD